MVDAASQWENQSLCCQHSVNKREICAEHMRRVYCMFIDRRYRSGPRVHNVLRPCIRVVPHIIAWQQSVQCCATGFLGARCDHRFAYRGVSSVCNLYVLAPRRRELLLQLCFSTARKDTMTGSAATPLSGDWLTPATYGERQARA